MVEQGLKQLADSFQATIQLDLFEELFRRRLLDEKTKIPKVLEAEFEHPENELEAEIHRHILKYRQTQNERFESELRKQKERLAEAERKLALRSSKSLLNEQRIASGKIERLIYKLEELRRTTFEPSDARIFPFWYAPVIIETPRGRVIEPMRYHCRGHDKPSNVDERYPGLYNARRDNLTGYWQEQFGSHHGIIVLRAFYENVSRHAYEQRSLLPNEPEENLVIQFRPESQRSITVACLWDSWQSRGAENLLSFAAITDNPPPEVATAGHDRCVVALAPKVVSEWLRPAGKSVDELQRILNEREPVTFSHSKAS
jgi:putative SOS response-associated peptidase YedK